MRRPLGSVAALLATCGTVVVIHAGTGRGAPQPAMATHAPTPSARASGVAMPVATGVIRLSDLIAQERRRPRRAPELRPAADENEAQERLERTGAAEGSALDAPHATIEPRAASTGPSPVPTVTFDAVAGSSPIPPDSTGAVGLTQVLTVTNHGLQAHTKSGGFLGAVTTWTFWGTFLPTFPFDPRVIYDPVEQRFIVIALDSTSSGGLTTNSWIYVAVSHTGDLLGGWTLRKYPTCAATPCGAADFPMVGLSRNFLAVHVLGNRTFVLSYPALRQTQGQPPAAILDAAGPGYLDSWGAPVVDVSATDGDLYFVKSNLGTAGDFRLNRLTGPPDAPTFMAGPVVSVPTHLAQVGCIPGAAPQLPEPGTGNVVTISNVPVNSDAVARDDHIWFTESRRVQATDCGGHARVLWLKLHKSGTFADGGVIEDATGRWYMYPTIAVNRFHDVLVGFTQTSAAEYASAAFAFRAATDPAGTMRDARAYKPGAGHFNLPYSAGVGRWGDYSRTVVDPGDDTMLWTIQEYARAQVGTGAGSGRWGTSWAAVNPRAAQPPGAPQALQASAIGSSVLLTWVAPGGGGAPMTYSVEAGSSPGLSNLVNFPTGNAALSFTAGGVPDGTYYVRVRASNTVGTSPPSNEATLVVGCTAAPGPPAALTTVTNSGGAVALAWQASSGGATSYIIEAGTGAGLADLLTLDLGSPNAGFTGSGVSAGTYFVRVRGRNRCGIGQASNEVTLVVN